MNLKRTAIIFVGGAALAAWLSAAIAPARPPIASQTIAPAPIDRTGAALASEIARLRERLTPSPAPRDTTRNPFVFRSRRSTSSFAPVSGAAAPTGVAPAVTLPGRPRLTLAGIAEDPATADGTVARTAIISGNGQLFLAKPGDVINDGNATYTVGAVSADAVELTALRDGITSHLSLK